MEGEEGHVPSLVPQPRACLEAHGTGLEGHGGLTASCAANEQALRREAASVEPPSRHPRAACVTRVLPGLWLRAAGRLGLTDLGSESRLLMSFMQLQRRMLTVKTGKGRKQKAQNVARIAPRAVSSHRFLNSPRHRGLFLAGRGCHETPRDARSCTQSRKQREPRGGEPFGTASGSPSRTPLFS